MATILRSSFLKQRNPIPSEPFVFLGGTCNGSTWREKFIPMLRIAHYNPVVDDWTKEDWANEETAKSEAAVVLYVISPKQLGRYNYVELAVSACKVAYQRLEQRTILVLLEDDDDLSISEHQQKSNEAIKNLLSKETNIEIYHTLLDAANSINRLAK